LLGVRQETLLRFRQAGRIALDRFGRAYYEASELFVQLPHLRQGRSARNVRGVAQTRMTRLKQILMLALAVRLLLPLAIFAHRPNPKVFQTDDTTSYRLPAEALLDHHRFEFESLPDIIRTPGYPLFLTAGLSAGHFEAVTILLQILLSVCTVYLVYRLALELWQHETVALCAALLYALEPLSILYSSLILSETLFTTLTTVFLLYLVRYLNRQQLADLLVSGLALAASVYVRPVALFLPLAVLLGLLVWKWTASYLRWQQWTITYFQLGLFALVAVGPLALWVMRNHMVAHYNGFSGIITLDECAYQAAVLDSDARQVSLNDAQSRLCGIESNAAGAWLHRHPYSAGELRMMHQHAAPVLREYRWRFIGQFVEGMAFTVVGPGATEYLRMAAGRTPGELWTPEPHKKVVLNALLACILLLTYALVFITLAYSWRAVLSRKINVCLVALLLVAGYFVLASGGPVGYSRLRHPVMPILCTLAGAGLYSLWQHRLLVSRRWLAAVLLLPGLLSLPSSVHAVLKKKHRRAHAQAMNSSVLASYGVVGDGVTDDSRALQRALNAGSIDLPATTYFVNSVIRVPSGRTIQCESGAVLRNVGPGPHTIFKFNSTSNSYLKGCILEGTNTRSPPAYDPGQEWNMGVVIAENSYNNGIWGNTFRNFFGNSALTIYGSLVRLESQLE
jgi:4-amino-4-deoxy-L-arabinose transferase-like glycosyltransferase